jgi:hypothetical protein
MCPAHQLFWIDVNLLFRDRSWRLTADIGSSISWLKRCSCIVIRLEGLESLQLLVDQCERLKFARLRHLLHEPRLCFILFDFFEIGVIVVDVS